jgi:hypothetical protein
VIRSVGWDELVVGSGLSLEHDCATEGIIRPKIFDLKNYVIVLL